MLYDLNSSKNLDFPYDDYGRFDFKEMDDSVCLAEFREKKRPEGSGDQNAPCVYVGQYVEGDGYITFGSFLALTVRPKRSGYPCWLAFWLACYCLARSNHCTDVDNFPSLF